MKHFLLVFFSLLSILYFSNTHTILPGGCLTQLQCKPDNFFELIDAIQQNLYRISAVELQALLNTNYDPIPTITADELLYDMRNKKDIFVINVLPKKLYIDCHIEESHSVPLKELICTAKEWPRDQRIVVYCALDICDAGQKAYILLSCMGFTNVIDYQGGIKEWFQLGYPTIGKAESGYLHAKNAKLPDELLKDLEECCGIELPRKDDSR